MQPVCRAVRKVQEEAADEYGDDFDFFMHLVAELGCGKKRNECHVR